MTFTFLDISKGETPLGRVVIRLDTQSAPKSSENFLRLCVGDHEFNGTNLTYKGNVFHRVVKNFMIQAGDISYGNVKDYPNENIGKGGVSIYASSTETESSSLKGTFEDENLGEFDMPMKVAMANIGSNTNSSQFFINTSASPHLNFKHTIFGIVVHGKSVVREIEKVRTVKDDIPVDKVVITNCGQWFEGDDVPIFNACYGDIGGDVYEEYPDDETKIGESTALAYNATNTIKESGTLLFKAGEKQKALLKYTKSLRYCNEFIPDQDSEPDYYNKFIELKKKLFLNLSLTCLNLKDYDETIKYCNYLLEMNDSLKLTTSESAKTHFRRGTALSMSKKYDSAVEDLNEAHRLLPEDKLIRADLLKIQNIIKDRKEKAKAKYSKFFG